jgi:hypothetical protein
MKAIALLITLTLFGMRANAIDNLIVNGDFATGTLAPWAPTGTVSVTAGLCLMNGVTNIDQTVTTKAGARYYLAGGAGTASGVTSYSVRATPAAGGTADVALDFFSQANSLRRFSIIFTATTASTRISISVNEGDHVGLVDNIVLHEIIVPSRFHGIYSGTVGIELKGNEGARTKSVTTASAQIDEDGKIVLLESTSRVHGGILFDDGTAAFQFAGKDQAAPVVTTRGRVLSLGFIEELSPSQDEGHNSVLTQRKLNFKLTRKSR